MRTHAEHPEIRSLEQRLPGERYWWIDGRGRVLVSDTPPRVVGDPPAEGRVCEASSIGVIERIDGRDAVLGSLCSGTLGLLCDRFAGVRWAIADPAASVTAAVERRRIA